MKKETAELLRNYLHLGQIRFGPAESGIEIDYTLTDEELLTLVETEYGKTQQDVQKLFQCILRTAIKAASDLAKAEK